MRHIATLKVELVYQTQWSTRDQARSATFEYIELLFYDRNRRHSALGYFCPTKSSHLIMNRRLRWKLDRGEVVVTL